MKSCKKRKKKKAEQKILKKKMVLLLSFFKIKLSNYKMCFSIKNNGCVLLCINKINKTRSELFI